MTGWQIFFSVVAVIIGVTGLLIAGGNLSMNFARTHPDDASKNIAAWLQRPASLRIARFFRNLVAPKTRRVVVYTASAVIFLSSVVGILYPWLQGDGLQERSIPVERPKVGGAPSDPNAATEAKPPSSPTAEPKTTAPQTVVQKYIAAELLKARSDLVDIRREGLSCDALSAWQERASTATRLAHANGIGIHNPISQHLSACRNITDVNLLDAIRDSIIKLLDQGIQAAGG